MSDDVVRLSLVGRVLRRRWPLLVCYAVVGVLAGMGASMLFSPGYETSIRVVVQGERTKDELATEAVIAANTVVLDRTAEALGWGVDGVKLGESVQAGVVAGNVVEISGTAATAERAQRLVDQVAEEYVAYSSQLVSDPAAASSQLLEQRRDALRKRIEQTHDRIDQLHRAATRDELTVDGVQLRTELETLRTALTRATEDLAEAEATSSVANLVVMGPAARPPGPAAPTMVHFAAGGGILFAVLGLLGHLYVLQSDRRLISPREMTAALGSRVVGAVAVRPARRRRWWFRRRTQGAAFDPESPEFVPYRRIVSRLRGPRDDELRLLLLAADDDRLAHRAVAGIVQAAGSDAEHLTTLRVARISSSAPALPEHDDVSSALVVASIATRRAWELAGIAEACSAAGYEVAGAVITRPARRNDGKPADAELVVSPNLSAGNTELAATR